MKVKKYTSMLGLAFEGTKLSVCLMQLVAGQPRAQKRLKFNLTLDPLASDPELAGREIRNHLDAAGIREHRCAVCLPLKWMLTLQTELPPLTGEDLDGFIALQAERSFPFAPEDLMIADSRLPAQVGAGAGMGAAAGQATVVAIARHSLDSLQRVFKAARLRPLLFTLGVAALPRGQQGAVLLAGEGGADLAIFFGGALAALRSLDEALEQGSAGQRWDAELIVRQVRITLGRLPGPLREAIGSLRILGAPDQAAELTRGLRDGLASLGLTVDEPEAAWSSAAAAATCLLLGQPPAFDFLPPRVSRFKQLAGRISARGALHLGGGVALLALLLGTIFFMQGAHLARLEREWATMKPKVTHVEDLQRKMRAFRPWFSDTPESLKVAAGIAAAFPAEGAVWVKTIEIKDLSAVTCTGNARSNRDWLALLEALRKTPGVTDLQVTQVRGNVPLQFSLSFHWQGGESDGR